ncbi:uncharacterized protein LOC110168903 [Boleophthalmus pectinirostris]|uniref:uncharacterized protein LOC110168903 n=1 Tax=Boleophthalmus pectinirostris TaxID=150288 RepID=UPI00242FC4C1|nr:uncharacterized protein LOC110168903 [Boleophthalmus pectinirostris]
MELETVKPGISLVLNCKVHFGTCAGEYRVHWFKQSEESAAGVLYSHGGSSDQCDNNTNTSTNSCVYSLPIHNVSSEQTGTYYCAVDACGQVLFGNGTRVNMKATVDPVFYILTGALVFTSVLVVFLVFSLFVVMKKNKRQNTAPACEDSETLSTRGNTETDPDHLHYAALSVNMKSRRQRNTDPCDCVYSRGQHQLYESVMRLGS